MSVPSLDRAPVSNVASAASDSYLEAQMNKVSRSFAVVVSCLKEPLLSRFSVAYLLCRVADNIEDCTEAAGWKLERFGDFTSLLRNPAQADQVLADWGRYAWPGLTADERKLMGPETGPDLWRLYAAIPDGDRAVIERWTAAMSRGMMQLGKPGYPPRFVQRDGVMVLEREEDYNQYCYIVAGTVGHMATELVTRRYDIPADAAHRLTANSQGCARALQKTNVLQDFAVDVGRGFCYLPDAWLQTAAYASLALAGAPMAFKRMVIEDILAELETSAQYVLDLPLAARDYRMASLVSLTTASQTLLAAATRHKTLFTHQHEVTLSLAAIGKCMLDARRMAGDNAKVTAYSRQLRGEIRRALDSAATYPVQ